MANYTAPAAKASNGQLLHTEFNLLAAETQELSAAMPDKAPIDSPTFTGSVTLPAGAINMASVGGLSDALR